METSSKRVVVQVLLASSAAAVVAAGFCSWRPLLERWYLWKLESTDEHERKSAAHSLRELRSMRAVPTLLDLAMPDLEEAANEWRTDLPYTAKAVVDMGPDAVPTLMERLRDTAESPEVRRASTYVLGAMKIPATAPLIAALGDADPQIRVYALGALMGMPRFMKDLRAAYSTRPTRERCVTW